MRGDRVKSQRLYGIRHRKHRRYGYTEFELKLMAQRLIYKAKCEYLEDLVETQSEVIDKLLK